MVDLATELIYVVIIKSFISVNLKYFVEYCGDIILSYSMSYIYIYIYIYIICIYYVYHAYYDVNNTI